MNKLLIATHNPAKKEELKKWIEDSFNKHAKGVRLQLLMLSDAGITEDVEENGVTFEENAKKKALLYARKSGLPAIADDAGVEIDYLGGKPGVFSKRWTGKDHPTDDDIISYTLSQLDGVPPENRGAQMHVVVALAFPDGTVHTADGIVRGMIARTRHPTIRTHGFPYRALFFIPEIGKYYNHIDMTPDEEIRYNHRRKAIIKLFNDYYQNNSVHV